MEELSTSEVVLASMTPEEAREFNQGNKENTLIYRAAKAKAAQEAGQTMHRDEAADRGKDILSTMADLYQLIDWAEEQEDGDPYLKMVFYKSGKFTIETYKDDEVAEFTIDQITQK